MQFEGRIKKIMPLQSGTSAAGKEWMKQEFVFEYFERKEDRFSDSVPLSIMNERIKEYDIHEGDECIIGFGHRTREYNGRLYPDIYIYHFEKIVRVNQASSQPTVSQPGPQTAQPQAAQHAQPFPPQQPAQDDDKLPF